MSLPDPAKLSRRLPRQAKIALRLAYRSHDGLRVDEWWQDETRPFGLIDARTPYLSAFGLKVRAEVLKARDRA
jgi:hypothetical protein